MVDGLFVCNSHIGVHGKEAMTRTGRRDAMLMRDEAALHLARRGHFAAAIPPNCTAAGHGFLLHTPVTVTHHRRANTPEGVCSCPNTCASSQRSLHSMAALLGTLRVPTPRTRADQTVQRYS
jgi:hypothetical protein